MKKGLDEAGFVVDVAGDDINGLEFAKSVDFDLIILDIMLPTLDGWLVLTQLRQGPQYPGSFFLQLAMRLMNASAALNWAQTMIL